MHYYCFLVCCLLLTKVAVGMSIDQLVSTDENENEVMVGMIIQRSISTTDKEEEVIGVLHNLKNKQRNAEKKSIKPLKKIKKIKNSERIHPCHLCKGVYTSEKERKRHVKTQHNKTSSRERMYHCFECIIEILKKTRTITDPELNSCAYTPPSARTKHLQEKHGVIFNSTIRGYESKKILCPSCGQSYSADKGFIRHIFSQHRTCP